MRNSFVAACACAFGSFGRRTFAALHIRARAKFGAKDAMNRARVVIVDDSPTMRKWLSAILSSDPRLKVVGEAGDAHEARKLIKAVEPDVITLDIEMPRMNGLDFLERIMRLRPMPVVMISSLTRKGSAAAVKALSIGALHCIWKPENPRDIDPQNICDSIFVAANARVAGCIREPLGQSRQLGPEDTIGSDRHVVLLGASTGGVKAIEAFLGRLPLSAPPVVIAQHMPEHFLRSFSSRLNKNFDQDVAMAESGECLTRGQVRIAPASELQTAVRFSSNGWQTVFERAAQPETYRPSVDYLFRSALAHARHVIAIILTGLGKDGACEMRRLRDSGAITLGQSESSCVVYGMPRAAKECGAVMEEARVEHIADRMIALVNHNAEA